MTANDLIEIIKRTLKERSANGIRGLARAFKNMDENGNKKLDPDDFRWGLYGMGVNITKQEATLIVDVCDRDKDGSVDYDEFLRFVRVHFIFYIYKIIQGDLSEARKQMIKKAYEKLDKNKDGKVTLTDIILIYDASHHPDVKEGKKDPEEVLKEFMS